ncbi:MAG: 3-oxoacyl-[acyl-carrier-protein] reductase [bacterium]
MLWGDSVALVTGASRGIGKAIAEALCAKGARVYLCARNLEAVTAAAREISCGGGAAVGLQMDVGRPDEVKSGIQAILREAGRIDILVNNAGIRRDKLLVRTQDCEWQEVLDANLSGSFYCTRQAIAAMSRQRYGRIVNVGSVVAFTGNAGQANYAAAKAGLVGLTRSAAREYASRGVTINLVAPGFIETDMITSLPEPVRRQILAAIPMGRLGSPREVADTVAFLASPEAGYITGQVLHVNGGLYA